MLNRELQRKYLLPKSEAQRQRNEQQSKARAEHLLKQDPKTRERERKKTRKQNKTERIMMNKTVKVYAVNAATVTNKMETVQRRDPNFVMISEAGLRKQKSPEVE